MDYDEIRELRDKTMETFSNVFALASFMTERGDFVPYELENAEEWLSNQVYKLNKALADVETTG